MTHLAENSEASRSDAREYLDKSMDSPSSSTTFAPVSISDPIFVLAFLFNHCCSYQTYMYLMTNFPSNNFATENVLQVPIVVLVSSSTNSSTRFPTSFSEEFVTFLLVLLAHSIH